MRIYARVAAILTALAISLLTVQAPVWAAPKTPMYHGYPLCITTTWASHHYGVPKTARHTTCAVKMHKDTSYPSKPGEATLESWSAAWYPSSWQLIGIISDPKTLNPTAMLVRRP
jgi:hypothetical protein